MTTKELAALREEVNALYIRRINHELSDEEADDYFDKDRLLFALDKGRFTNATIGRRGGASRAVQMHQARNRGW